jgi:hypothetical protein
VNKRLWGDLATELVCWLIFALMLACLLALLARAAGGAPVPKRPAELTKEQVVGTWSYSWGAMPNGIIAFAADGTYAAQHEPGGAVSYAGTWAVEGGTVTIQECSYDFATGEFRGGPVEYRFEFKAADYPNLRGLSNGSTKVALTNPVR